MVQKCVLLPVSTPLSYAIVAPVARALASDPRIRIVVASRHGGARLARECLDVPHRYVPLLLARFTRFDLALCPGFFYRGFRGTPLVQVFHGVSPKNYAVGKDVARFDRLFLTGEYHRRKFVRAGLLAEDDDARGLRVGMPKTDPLVAGAGGARRLPADFGLDPALPLVAYAPTRSGSHGSSIDDQGLAVIDALAELPVNVVVKLHDRSQRRFRSRLENDYEAAIEERSRRARVRLWRGFDVIPLLAIADVLVSDLSSVTNEFLLRDRPIVYLTVEKHERKLAKSGARRFGADDPEGLEWMRAAGEAAATPCAARAAVDRALADPAKRSGERRDRARVMFYNPGTATRVAVEHSRRLLGLSS